MTDKTQAMKLALEALKQIDEAMPFPVAKLAQAALQEALATPQPLPDVLTQEYGDSAEYVEGWNECREVMKGMMK